MFNYLYPKCHLSITVLQEDWDCKKPINAHIRRHLSSSSSSQRRPYPDSGTLHFEGFANVPRLCHSLKSCPRVPGQRCNVWSIIP